MGYYERRYSQGRDADEAARRTVTAIGIRDDLSDDGELEVDGIRWRVDLEYDSAHLVRIDAAAVDARCVRVSITKHVWRHEARRAGPLLRAELVAAIQAAHADARKLAALLG